MQREVPQDSMHLPAGTTDRHTRQQISAAHPAADQTRLTLWTVRTRKRKQTCEELEEIKPQHPEVRRLVQASPAATDDAPQCEENSKDSSKAATSSLSTSEMG